MKWLTALIPDWWMLAAGGMVLVVLAGGAWKLRHGGLVAGRAEIQIVLDKERAEIVAKALTASETARLREQAAQKANERIDHDFQTQKTKLAADKRVTDDSLRSLQAAINQPGVIAAPLGGADDPRNTIIDSCAAAFVGMDEYAKGVASKANGLQRYIREVLVAP